jgi:7-cyano-7-deazaguanine reductase
LVVPKNPDFPPPRPQRTSETDEGSRPMPQTLETFPNQFPDRDYQIEITCPEFTAVCPKTGQPDFGTIVITYVPGATCVELKSLKLYLQDFRNRGIYYEHSINSILDDLVRACGPRSMSVEGRFTPRGGISSRITARYEASAPGPDSR